MDQDTQKKIEERLAQMEMERSDYAEGEELLEKYLTPEARKLEAARRVMRSFGSFPGSKWKADTIRLILNS